MKTILTFFFLSFVLSLTTRGQELAPAIVSHSQSSVLDLSSNNYTRVFDGFRIKNGELPKNIATDKIIETGDTIRLKNLGIVNIHKRYMFLNSEVTDLRLFIYKKAKLSNDYSGVNLPLVINKQLITFDKYSILDKIDTNRIAKVMFVKDTPLKMYADVPLGVIMVTYK